MDHESTDKNCDCGHEHHHGEDCGCGHEHDHIVYDIFQDGELNEAASGFLSLLQTHKFLPCAQFVVTSTKEPSFSSVALAPVFITDGEESVGFLRKIGEVLLGLEQQGYISIDYDIPLEGFDYGYFTESAAWRQFEATVAEAKGSEDFLGDTASIEFGSIAPLNAD